MSSNDFLEYLMLQRMTGGDYAGTQAWLQVAFLVCLFAAAVFRPEVIRSRTLFRAACLLFVLSLLVSPTMNYLLGFVMQGPFPGRFRGADGETFLLLSLPAMLASVLFGISLICGLLSLGLARTTNDASGTLNAGNDPYAVASPHTPRDRSVPSPSPPRPHPLDEPD